MRPSASTDGRPTLRLLGPAAAVLLLGLAAGGCRELATVADVTFPATVPGLPPDQPWVSLPVRRWLTETGIEPLAVSACFAPACSEPAAAMLLRARGRDAAELVRAASDPGGLAAALNGGPSPPADRKGRRPPRARAVAEPEREGEWAGSSLRLARPDGRRSAAGYVLTARRGDSVTALVIVAPTLEAARRLGRSIAPHLGD